MKRTKGARSQPSTKQQPKPTRRRVISDTDLKQAAGGAHNTPSHRKAGKGQQEITVTNTQDKASPFLS